MAEEPLLPLSAVSWIGEDLKRPECVLTTAKGEVFAGDHHAGIAEIGKPRRKIIGAPPGFLPNGVAMLPTREFLIANLGPGGGVWRLDRDWRLFPHLFEADSELLRVCNFVGIDAQGTEWISVSTRTYPRERSFRPHHADGFIVRHDRGGARIVADGIGFSNECRVDPTGAWLYVNETCAKRISRFPIKGNTLGQRQTVHAFGAGEFPDGFAFDGDGGVWVACVNANRVIRIESNGRRSLILDGSLPELIAEGEAFFAADQGGRHHVELGARSPLKNIASVAFGGADLKTVYLGNLAGDRIATFRSPIAGAEPVQWRF
ncbi:MAG TPA: SMP-30/gluconolactonase/LRE family protein [Hyphomicrobiaceae bacterium]|nr:SMP-30/gluconolactonase/LRE family protein [Hyphomicrobiaceae bacterium]